MKSIHTLVEDIQDLFNAGHTFDPTNLTGFSEKLGANLANSLEKYKEGRKPELWLSNVGKPLRQLWFEINGPKYGYTPEPLSPSTKLKFAYGDLLEQFIIALAIEAGHKVERLQERVEVDAVRGRIDCTIDGVLVDVKSCSSRSFQKFLSHSLSKDDPFGYVGQLSGYSTASGGFDGCFLAIDKTLGHLCLDYYTKEELAEYNVREKIRRAREALSLDTPYETYCYEPVPDGKSGNLRLPTGCSYCSHKWNCHKGLRGFAYSSGPVYLTHVERLPNVPEITSNYTA